MQSTLDHVERLLGEQTLARQVSVSGSLRGALELRGLRRQPSPQAAPSQPPVPASRLCAPAWRRGIGNRLETTGPDCNCSPAPRGSRLPIACKSAACPTDAIRAPNPADHEHSLLAASVNTRLRQGADRRCEDQAEQSQFAATPGETRSRPGAAAHGRRLQVELEIILAILERLVIEKILTQLGLQSRAPPCSPGSGQAACSARPCHHPSVEVRRPPMAARAGRYVTLSAFAT